jgi:hypothetical protein
MFHTSQCSTSSVPLPVGASRSWTISTKLAAASGAFAQASGGDTSWPGCACLSGILAPSVHALVVNAIAA